MKEDENLDTQAAGLREVLGAAIALAPGAPSARGKVGSPTWVPSAVCRAPQVLLRLNQSLRVQRYCD